jgi:hypothetical protein
VGEVPAGVEVDLIARVERAAGAELQDLAAQAGPKATANAARVVKDRSTLGLLSYPHFISDADDRRALDERAIAMGERALELVDQALADPDSWLIRDLGAPPVAPQARATWHRNAAVVTAYRELHGYHGPTADVVRDATNRAQVGEATAAAAAARRARHISDMHAASTPPLGGASVGRTTERPSGPTP